MNDTRSNVTHCLVMLFACSLYCPIGKWIEGHIHDDVYPLSTEIFVFFSLDILTKIHFLKARANTFDLNGTLSGE